MAGVKGRSGGKPKVFKELAGTCRADRHNVNEPNLPALVSPPRCPSHLRGKSQQAWRRRQVVGGNEGVNASGPSCLGSHLHGIRALA